MGLKSIPRVNLASLPVLLSVIWAIFDRFVAIVAKTSCAMDRLFMPIAVCLCGEAHSTRITLVAVIFWPYIVLTKWSGWRTRAILLGWAY
jgi:hypothetical protein